MSNNLVVKLDEKGVDHAVGRVVGINMKDAILKEFKNGKYEKITLDFTDVDFVTSGFAKELFGGLYEVFGDMFRSIVSIRIEKGDDTMKNNIMRAMAAAIRSANI